MLTSSYFRTELDFSVAVDFTKSNLPMEEEASLHHIDAFKGTVSLTRRQQLLSVLANQYEIAIASVGDICQHYNSRRYFKGYGFGAKIPPETKVRYNFPLVSLFKKGVKSC